MYKGLLIHEHGVPHDVLRVETLNLPKIRSNQVLIEMSASPINPADINLIEGKYPVPVTFPLIPGNEGVGRIVEMGSEVEGFSIGQYVIPGPDSASWCDAQIQDSQSIISVPDNIPPTTAAMMSVNPTTAWRLLHDFIKLQPGDWIVQNAANSVLGRCVIQMAKHLGFKTCNLVRREELIQPLMKLGATVVIAEEEPHAEQILEHTEGADIHLGINAVGGRSVVEMAKAVAPQSTIVTVGAMGMRPLTIPNGLLIFKNVTFAGFWLKSWTQNAKSQDILDMFHAVLDIAAQGKLEVPVEATYPLEEAIPAIEHATKGSRNGKVLFEMNHWNN